MKRGFAVLALAACVASLGCSEERKFEARRTPSVSRTAPRRESSTSPTPIELVTNLHEPESAEEKPHSCAPDAVLTGGEAIATSGPAIGRPSTVLAIETTMGAPAAAGLPPTTRSKPAERSIVTLSQLETQAVPSNAPQAATPLSVPTYDALSPGDSAAMIKQAEEHNRRGLTFASKGAVFSARKEFHEALRAVAAALDAAERSMQHRTMLTSGLAALTEMDDFGSGDADVSATVAGHASQLVTSEAAAGMSPVSLREWYRDSAVERLTFAVASPTGSVALHRLGKISLLGTSTKSNTARTQARVLLEAALRVDANNFPAANDLAVHLAEDGYYDRAVALLRDGLTRSPQPALWTNLAAIHELRGEAPLAQAARLEARSLTSRGSSGVLPTHNVAWVDARAFAAASQPSTEIQSVANVPVNAVAKSATVMSPATANPAAPAAAAAPTPAVRSPITTAAAPRRNAMVQ